MHAHQQGVVVTPYGLLFLRTEPPKEISGKTKYNLHRINDGWVAESGWFACDEEVPAGYEYYGKLEVFSRKAIQDPRGYATRKGWAKWYTDWFVREVNRLGPLRSTLAEKLGAFDSLALTHGSVIEKLTRPFTAASPVLDSYRLALDSMDQFQQSVSDSIVAIGSTFANSQREYEEFIRNQQRELNSFFAEQRELPAYVGSIVGGIGKWLELDSPFDLDRLLFNERTSEEQIHEVDRFLFGWMIQVLSDPNSSDEERNTALEEFKHRRKHLRQHCGRIADHLIEAGDRGDWHAVLHCCLIVAELNGWLASVLKTESLDLDLWAVKRVQMLPFADRAKHGIIHLQAAELWESLDPQEKIRLTHMIEMVANLQFHKEASELVGGSPLLGKEPRQKGHHRPLPDEFVCLLRKTPHLHHEEITRQTARSKSWIYDKLKPALGNPGCFTSSSVLKKYGYKPDSE